RRFAAGIDGVEQVASGNFGETFQLDDLLMGQAVKIRRGSDQTPVHQLLDNLVAQAIDIHGTARDEMDDRLLELRLAGQAPDAAVDGALADRLATLAAFDQLGALDCRTAHRALLRHLHSTSVSRAAFRDKAEDLRNHVACAAYDHGVADHHAEACHFVHVVQGGIGDGNARHLYRLEPSHWG